MFKIVCFADITYTVPNGVANIVIFEHALLDAVDDATKVDFYVKHTEPICFSLENTYRKTVQRF